MKTKLGEVQFVASSYSPRQIGLGYETVGHWRSYAILWASGRLNVFLKGRDYTGRVAYCHYSYHEHVTRRVLHIEMYGIDRIHLQTKDIEFNPLDYSKQGPQLKIEHEIREMAGRHLARLESLLDRVKPGKTKV